MKNLTITLIQSNLFWENVSLNLSNFEKIISSIKDTDIILLPEMFNTAFCPKSNHLAESMDGKTISWMKEISKTRDCAIAGTLMIMEGKNIFNRLVWILKNGTIYTYDKHHLFSLIKEEKYISKGKKRLIVEVEGWKICPLICYDLRFPVFSRNDVEYDMLIYLANWPVKRIDAWNTLLKARSIENQCYTIGVNRVGEDGNEISFNGHSKIFDAFGKELFSTTENKEEVLQFEISLDDLKLKRRQMNFLQDRDNFSLL
ncbi:MAG: nitrilase family protein [Flavobacteriales bacterium]|jgi:omega-amidase|nr:nitrilase family protein [Flavobacteriales bacterium]